MPFDQRCMTTSREYYGFMYQLHCLSTGFGSVQSDLGCAVTKYSSFRDHLVRGWPQRCGTFTQEYHLEGGDHLVRVWPQRCGTFCIGNHLVFLYRVFFTPVLSASSQYAMPLSGSSYFIFIFCLFFVNVDPFGSCLGWSLRIRCDTICRCVYLFCLIVIFAVGNDASDIYPFTHSWS